MRVRVPPPALPGRPAPGAGLLLARDPACFSGLTTNRTSEALRMMLVKTEKRQSKIHGIGLFAAEFIPEGKPTWRFIPGIDQAIHPDVVPREPEPSRHSFLTYAYLDIKTGLYVLCSDDARFMNHSEEPNVRGDYELDEVFGVDVAARDIEPGEELLCDYRTFDRIDRDSLHFQD